MKKVTITYYTGNDNIHSKEMLKDLISTSTSCSELIKISESQLAETSKSNRYILYSETSVYSNANLFKIEEITEDNEEAMVEKFNSLSGSYYNNRKIKYTGEIGSYPIPSHMVYLGSRYSSLEYETLSNRAFVLDMENESHIEFLKKFGNPKRIIDSLFGLSIVRSNGNLYAEVKNRPNMPFILDMIDTYPVEVFTCCMQNLIYTPETIEEDSEIRDNIIAIMNTIIDDLIEEGADSDNKLSNILSTLITGSENAFKKEGEEANKRFLNITYDEVIDMIDKIISDTNKKKAIPKITKILYSTSSLPKGVDALIGYVLKKYDLITDEEITISNKIDEDLESPFEKLEHLISKLAVKCVYINQYTTTKSASWCLDITTKLLHNFRYIVDSEAFEKNYILLTDEEKDKLFENIKQLFKRYLIIKELPDIFWRLNYFPKDGDYDNQITDDYFERLTNVILDIFDDYKGNEVMTIRSIISRRVYLRFNGNNNNIFDDVQNHHKRLRKLIVEAELK